MLAYFYTRNVETLLRKGLHNSHPNISGTRYSYSKRPGAFHNDLPILLYIAVFFFRKRPRCLHPYPCC